MSKQIDPRFQVLATYVRQVANDLRLADWNFRVLTQPAEEGSYADISCAQGRKAAAIRFCSEFFEIDENGQRHTVVHELIHAHLHRLHAAVQDLEGILGHQEFRIFYDRFIESLEYTVDGLADAFAPYAATMPSTEQAKPRGKAKAS